MAQHAILRFEKHKGNPARPLEAHHERQKEQYASNPDIDTSRSKYNFHIVKPESRYYHFIQSRIEQVGCRTRKDSTRFVDTLVTASPEFFKRKSPKEIQAFFQRAADFLIDRVGRENIVSAVVHMDEKTPHLHLTFVPLTKDNRLCAKEIIGNRANLTKWQDDFHAYMVEKYPDLERGESASKTGRKHIPTRLFKQAVNLSKQARAIEATLDGINPLNAGKKKEEALSMLKKWFPQMGNFSGQLKKYKVTINDLLAENEKLEENQLITNILENVYIVVKNSFNDIDDTIAYQVSPYGMQKQDLNKIMTFISEYRHNLLEQKNKNVNELDNDPLEASIIRIKGKLIVVELESGSTHVGVVDYDAVNKDAIVEKMRNSETNMYGRLENYIRVLVKMEPNKEPGRPDMARIIALR